MGNHLSKEERERAAGRNERIIELRKQGRTISLIAAETGVTDRTVGRVLRRAKLTHGDHFKPPYPQEKWDEVEAWLREEEGSYIEASRTFGISQDAIARRFPDLGWRREEAGRFAGQLNRIMHRMEKVTYANS